MTRNPASPDTLPSPAATVKTRAIELGFDLVGICPARPSDHAEPFRQWLAAGRHADMTYMERHVERRLSIAEMLPGARSVVMVAVSCNVRLPDPPASLRFARYALNDDYHDWMRPRLRALGAAIESVLHEQRSAGVSPATSACRWRPFCDTSAVLEREHAFGAGLGWIGKNTMLINRSLGSHILIGGIVVDRELEPDPPAPGTCGRCRRCLDACPTGAIVAPYILDARLCIAYHTIESRGPIPEAVAKHMGDRVFGCDICQEVCPFNGPRVPETGHPEFMPRAAAIGRSANDLASITDDEFRMQFRRSAVRRAKPAGLRRNAIASMKSTGEGPAGPSPPDPSDPSDPPAYLSRSAFARFA